MISVLAYLAIEVIIVGQVITGHESWLPLAMPVLAWIFARALRRTTLSSLAFVTGLGLSFAGDITEDFLPKMALFAGVHVAYIVALRGAWRGRPIHLGVVIPGGAAIALVALLSGPLWPAVVGYGVLILVMANLAASYSREALVGAIAFIVSDLLIALQAVRPELESNWLSAVAVGLYLAAQGCLAAAVIKEENA